LRGALTDFEKSAEQRISYNTRYFSGTSSFSASRLFYTASSERFIDRYPPAGNYGLVIAVLAVYALWVFAPFPEALYELTHFTPTRCLLTVVRFRITNPLLLISLGFIIGGFTAINRWGE
jgi:hypothetical protein